MHPKNKITPIDRERLDGEIHSIYAEALKIELADLDQTARQLKNLAAAVEKMAGHVAALRGKWFPGCNTDDGPVIQYKPKYETREEVRP